MKAEPGVDLNVAPGFSVKGTHSMDSPKRKQYKKDWNRKRYLERKAAGVCVICGGPLGQYKLKCDKHAVISRINVRRWGGYKPMTDTRCIRVPDNIAK